MENLDFVSSFCLVRLFLFGVVVLGSSGWVAGAWCLAWGHLGGADGFHVLSVLGLEQGTLCTVAQWPNWLSYNHHPPAFLPFSLPNKSAKTFFLKKASIIRKQIVY